MDGDSDRSFPIQLGNVCLTKTDPPADTYITASDKNACPGQLIPNGSFERPWSGLDPRLAEGWGIKSDFGSYLYSDEGRNCAAASQGTCSMLLYADTSSNPESDTYTHALTSKVVVPLQVNQGDVYEFSGDVRIDDRYINFSPYVSVGFYPVVPGVRMGASAQSISLSFPSSMQKNVWYRVKKTVTATAPYKSFIIGNRTSNAYTYRIDNLCLHKISP